MGGAGTREATAPAALAAATRGEATDGKERKSKTTGQREGKRRKRQKERAETRTRKAAAAEKEGGEAVGSSQLSSKSSS